MKLFTRPPQKPRRLSLQLGFIGPRRALLGRGQFNVRRDLFGHGEQGVWYDPQDLSTMFQDSAGTTPVTVPGGGSVDPPVGKILDKSGRGNHAIQATAAARPTLSGRYNLLTKTATTDVAPWAFSNVSGTATQVGNVITFGASASDKLTQTTVVSEVAGVSYTAKVTLAGSGNIRLTIRDGNNAIDSPATTIALTSTPTAYSVTYVATVTGALGGIVIYNNALGTAGANFTVYNADMRLTSDSALNIPVYQAVTDASNYSTAGFPLYLTGDGIDNGMATAETVDFTGTDKITAWAGVTKLSDSAVGILVEHGTGAEALSATFVAAPRTAASKNYGCDIQAGGLTDTTQTAAGGNPAPDTSVITVLADYAQATKATQLALRCNGSSTGTVSTGTGPLTSSGFGNYTIYLMRRGGASLPFNGRLTQLIVRGAASNASQIAMANRVCGKSCGVAL